jgi:AAA+ ATPase superfamily predicted ATPase
VNKKLKKILATLRKDNVLLAAPRRFGKTSIMRKLEKNLLDNGNVVIFLDVESVYSPQRFLSEVIMELTAFEEFSEKSSFLSQVKKKCKHVQNNLEEVEVPTLIKAKLRKTWMQEMWHSKLSKTYLTKSSGNTHPH